MIKHVVFDMGGVLFHTDRTALCMRFCSSREDAKALENAIFSTVEWLMLDRGTIDVLEAETRFCMNLPERLHSAVHGVLDAWHTVGSPIPGMEALIRKLKENGYAIYLLSNTAVTLHTRLRPLLPAIDCFDGVLISADCHLLKPDPAIYRTFLAQFSLAATECLFIDDSLPNVEAAQYVGMQSVLFSGSSDALTRSLHSLHIAC